MNNRLCYLLPAPHPSFQFAILSTGPTGSAGCTAPFSCKTCMCPYSVFKYVSIAFFGNVFQPVGSRAGQPRGRSSSPGRVKNFLFSTSSRPAVGSTQPPIQCVTGVKRQGHEADHSPPVSAEVKKMWIYTSTPHTPSWSSA
jgi:hypothetical protein